MKPDYFDMIQNCTFSQIGHAADLVWVLVGTFSIHISSTIGIYLNDIFIASSEDLFRDYEGRQMEFVSKSTLFDKKVAFLNDHSCNYQVKGILIDKDNMLQIYFSHGLIIQSLPQKCNVEDDEIWRIFIKKSEFPHMVGYSKTIKWE